MVFFIENWCVMRRTESGLPRTRSRRRCRPSNNSGSAARSRSSASGAAVSDAAVLDAATKALARVLLDRLDRTEG